MRRDDTRRLSTLTTIALLLAVIGFVLQLVAGVTNTPTIPPGLVVIVVAAGLVAFARGPNVPLAGPAAGLFGLVAFVVVGATDRLVDPTPATALAGAWLMVAGLIAATIAGTIATFQNHRRARDCTSEVMDAAVGVVHRDRGAVSPSPRRPR